MVFIQVKICNSSQHLNRLESATLTAFKEGAPPVILLTPQDEECLKYSVCCENTCQFVHMFPHASRSRYEIRQESVVKH